MSFLGIDSRNFRNKVESTFCGVPTITDPFERRCRGAGTYLKILGTKKFCLQLGLDNIQK